MPRWMSGWMDYTFALVWPRLLLCQKRENNLSQRIEHFTRHYMNLFIIEGSHGLQTSRSEDYRWPKALIIMDFQCNAMQCNGPEIFLLVARWNEKGRRTTENQTHLNCIRTFYQELSLSFSLQSLCLNIIHFHIIISDSMGTENRSFARSMNKLTEHFIWYIFKVLIICVV